jgi:hypothetical protein
VCERGGQETGQTIGDIKKLITKQRKNEIKTKSAAGRRADFQETAACPVRWRPDEANASPPDV